MDTVGRSGPDLTVDYLSASWTSADAGDSKSIGTRIKNDGIHRQGSKSIGGSICLRIQRLQPVTYSWTLGRNRAFLLEALAPQPSR